MPKLSTPTAATDHLFSLLHPIFRDCVVEDIGRDCYSVPFVIGGYVYATNRYTVARSVATEAIIEAFDDVPLNPRTRYPVNSRHLFRPDERFEPIPLPNVVWKMGLCSSRVLVPGVRISGHLLIVLHRHNATISAPPKPTFGTPFRFSVPGVEGRFLPMKPRKGTL